MRSLQSSVKSRGESKSVDLARYALCLGNLTSFQGLVYGQVFFGGKPTSFEGLGYMKRGST